MNISMKTIAAGILYALLTVSSIHGETMSWDQEYSGTTALLARWVASTGLVDYVGLKQNGDELEAVLRMYAELQETTLQNWPKPAQLVYYMNAYNLYTLRAIIRAYPIRPAGIGALLHPASSIRQIPGVWDKPDCTLAGKNLSLNQIEHEIIRPVYGEPRIHLALVCAALSCPPLRKEAYRAQDLEEQFADQARRFIQDPTKHRIVPGQTVSLSSIFKWYGSDFIARFGAVLPMRLAPAERAVINYIKPFESNENRAWLEQGEYSVKHLPYNWGLNEAPKKAQTVL